LTNIPITAPEAALAVAVVADTAVKHAKMRLNVGYDYSGVRMELNEG